MMHNYNFHARIQKIFSGGGVQISRRGLTESFNMAKINNLAIPGGRVVRTPCPPPIGSAHDLATGQPFKYSTTHKPAAHLYSLSVPCFLLSIIQSFYFTELSVFSSCLTSLYCPVCTRPVMRSGPTKCFVVTGLGKVL